MRDDDIAEAMSRGDPAQAVHDARSDAQIRNDLDTVLSTPVGRVPGRTSLGRWVLLAIPVGVAGAAALALLFGVWSPHTVHEVVATPPLLEVVPVRQTVPEILGQAIALLDAAPARSAQRQAKFEDWSLQDAADDPDPSHAVITPKIHEVGWSEDLSGTTTVTTGHSYRPTSDYFYSPESPPTESVPLPGTVLSHESFAPGSMPVIFRDPPPTDARQWETYLRASDQHADADPAADLLAMRTLLNEWTPSPRSEAALLRGLTDIAGLTVAGEVTDRLGRSGFALRVISPSSPHFEYLLILGKETGRIISLETIYVGGLAGFDVTSPAVTEYTAWK